MCPIVSGSLALNERPIIRIRLVLSRHLPALASRSFAIFLAGHFVSQVGSWMQTTVQAYLAYRLTSAPIYLGAVGTASTLPAMLLALPAGVWVERVNKRHAVMALQAVMMAQSLALAVLTLSGRVTIAWIIALAFVNGAANAVEITARQAMLGELAGPAALPNAIALQATSFNVARVLGPALAAPLLITFGEGWVFLLNGLSYAAVIGCLAVARPVVELPRATGSLEIRAAFGALREGLAYTRNQPLVSAVVVMAAVVGLVAFPNVGQLPAFARDVLARPTDTQADVATRTSALITAQGFGALGAALMLTVFGQRVQRKGVAMLLGQSAFTSGLLLLGLSRSEGVSMAALVMFGWGTVTTLANSNTLVQLVAPPSLRSRVISTYLWALQGSAPVGSLLVSSVAQHVGASKAALLSGLVCAAVYLLLHWRVAVVRRFNVQAALNVLEGVQPGTRKSTI